jgi:hypothetical protein
MFWPLESGASARSAIIGLCTFSKAGEKRVKM